MGDDASQFIARVTISKRKEAKRLQQQKMEQAESLKHVSGGGHHRLVSATEKGIGRATAAFSLRRSNLSSTESTKQNVGDDGYPTPPGMLLQDPYLTEGFEDGMQFPEGTDIYRSEPSSAVEPIHSQERSERPENFSSEQPKPFSNSQVPNTNFRTQLSSTKQQTLYNPDTDFTLGLRPNNQKKAMATFRPIHKYDQRTHQFHAETGSGDNGHSRNSMAAPQKPPETGKGLPRSHLCNDQTELGYDTSAEPEPKLLLQPETKAISHDQLVTEVRGIYAGLVMVEAKCIDVDEKQLSAALDKHSRSRLNPEQWQALIALHKTLLHEHHDFFLASQHPSASSALSHLAAKYSMPARMWKHGIHAFLEVLRHRLPESLDHMLAFIYIAYSMMALLFETVPAFEDTWIECLGDIARYRMAIEDDDIRDREVWSGVARFWYGKAADKNPKVGRLYHHLAILARPFTVLQLSLYLRAMTCITFFDNAKSSIKTLFDPVLTGEESTHYRPSSIETMFIKAHGLLFTGQFFGEFPQIVRQLSADTLDVYIGKTTAKFKEQGACIAIANAAVLFEYGVTRDKQDSRSIFRLEYQEHFTSNTQKDGEKPVVYKAAESPTHQLTEQEYSSSIQLIAFGSVLTFETFIVALRRIGDKNVYPLVHVYLVLIWSLLNVPKALVHVEMDIPWIDLATFLTALVHSTTITPKMVGPMFPEPEKTAGRPLFEDFLMRGQYWSESYFPHSWFLNCKVDDEERGLELASMTAERIERIIWLAMLIVKRGTYLNFLNDTKAFSATPYAGALVRRNVNELEVKSQNANIEVINSNSNKYENPLQSLHAPLDHTRASSKRPSSKAQPPYLRKESIRKGRGQSKRSPPISNSIPQKRILTKNDKIALSDPSLTGSVLNASQDGSPSKGSDIHASNVQRLDTMNLSDQSESRDSLIF